MVLIPVYNILYFRLQVFLPQTPTHEKSVDGHVSSIYSIFVMLVVAQLLSGCGFGTQYLPSLENWVQIFEPKSWRSPWRVAGIPCARLLESDDDKFSFFCDKFS